MEYKDSNDHLLGYTTIFILLSFVAATMLFIALLLWLAESIGSLIGALLIIGCAATIIALLLYFGAVRPKVIQMREEIAALQQIALLAHSAYRRLIGMIETFFK